MRTKTRFTILYLLAASFFLVLPLGAEESYERFKVRVWTYRDGTQATGKMITVSGPTATLRLDGKGTVRVPLEKLSVKDLNWIYEYHKRKKKLSFLPPKYRKPQKQISESKPEPSTTEPSTTEPAKTEPEKSQPDKKMTTGESKAEESYQPFTVREWNFKDGNKYQAKFLNINALSKSVVLLKKLGVMYQVSIDLLSEKDLDWLVEYHRRNKILAQLPEEYRDRVVKKQPATEPTSKPSVPMKAPDTPQKSPETVAEQKNKPKEMQAEGKAKATTEDDPKVVKADTEIDPVLVAALRDFRVWSDKKGQKSEARFTRIDGREVMFVTRTTGFARVHIGTLIEEDLQLLRDALKMHGRIDEIPLVYREPLDPSLSPSKLKQLIRVNNHRKWTDLSGNSVGASYIKMEEGKVFLLITKSGLEQEFPYLNFSPEDQAYVQERLQKEVPGKFFPAEAEVTLTPEEREKEFRIWTDRSKRQLKGKFVKLAFGESVAVINTGSKEELFIAEFFSDQDLSLLKPKKQKNTNELAMNNNNNNFNVGGIPRSMNRGMAGSNPFSNPGNPGMAQNPNMEAFPGMQEKRWEFTCPLCKKKHRSDFGIFQNCPHCGLKSTDTLYTCRKCNRTFKSDFQGFEAPCPHCNQNQPNRQVASTNAMPFESGRSGDNARESGGGSSARSGVSAYRSGRAIGKIFGWICLFLGFVAGAMKIRG